MYKLWIANTIDASATIIRNQHRAIGQEINIYRAANSIFILYKAFYKIGCAYHFIINYGNQ